MFFFHFARSLFYLGGGDLRVSDQGVFRATGVSDFIENVAKDLKQTPLPGRMIMCAKWFCL